MKRSYRVRLSVTWPQPTPAFQPDCPAFPCTRGPLDLSCGPRCILDTCHWHVEAYSFMPPHLRSSRLFLEYHLQITAHSFVFSLLNQNPTQVPFFQDAIPVPCDRFPAGLFVSCFWGTCQWGPCVGVVCGPASFPVLDEKPLEIKGCVVVNCGLFWLLAQCVVPCGESSGGMWWRNML